MEHNINDTKKCLFTSYLCNKNEPIIKIILKLWKQKNPDWDIKYFSDNDVKLFFKNTKYNNTYQKLRNGVAVADFFRICYIYENGGYWFDLDLEPFTVKITNNCSAQLFDCGYKNISYMFIGGCKNKLYEDVIKKVKKRINNNFKIKKKHIMNITGPRVIQSIIFDKLKIKNRDGYFPGSKNSKIYLEGTDYEFGYSKQNVKNTKTKLYQILQKKYNKVNYSQYNYI
jgi:mannosyltransferase OCH1-like enzyme